MSKKFKITEAQYSQLMTEGVAIQAVTNQNGVGIDNQATQTEVSQLKNPSNATITAPASAFQGSSSDNSQVTISEHRLITKKELQANRLRYLKENSEVLSLNNFLKSIH